MRYSKQITNIYWAVLTATENSINIEVAEIGWRIEKKKTKKKRGGGVVGGILTI